MRCIAAALLAFSLCASAALAQETPEARVARILAHTPLIDGHNDLAWEIRERYGSRLDRIDLAHDTAGLPHEGRPALMTDIPRLRLGHVGAQFWSVWVPPTLSGPVSVQTTVEQIDLVTRMAAAYPRDFAMAYTADDIVRIHDAGKIACLIGIEGGNAIDSSLAVLRQMYVLGARYMTLTHALNTPWADSATDNPAHHGLNAFGRAVIAEMNRLGMLVDLSHVSAETMRAALDASQAPVIFSHSGARALVDHPRDVPDDVLALMGKNGGVVMVNFYPGYVSAARYAWDADYAAEKTRLNAPPLGGLYIGQPERAHAALTAWLAAHPAPAVTVAQVADHVEHIAHVAGVEHVGIGSDFDGVPDAPAGLDGVDKFPALLVELARRGWNDTDLARVAGGNLLAAMRGAERVAARLQASGPPGTASLADAP